MSTDNIELKPCQFCGCKAVLAKDSYTESDRNDVVVCINCGASSAIMWNKKQAANMWNRRV